MTITTFGAKQMSKEVSRTVYKSNMEYIEKYNILKEEVEALIDHLIESNIELPFNTRERLSMAMSFMSDEKTRESSIVILTTLKEDLTAKSEDNKG